MIFGAVGFPAFSSLVDESRRIFNLRFFFFFFFCPLRLFGSGGILQGRVTVSWKYFILGLMWEFFKRKSTGNSKPFHSLKAEHRRIPLNTVLRSPVVLYCNS